jgi:3-dehydroquinate synthase
MQNVAELPDSELIHVALGERSYDIVIGAGRLRRIAGTIEPWLTQRFGRSPRRVAALVTDRNTANHAETVAQSLHAAGWVTSTIVLEPGEGSKSLEVMALLYDRLVGLKADRRTVVFAVGGGVIGDAAGFAAATYNRGLPFVQIPTTLLADVDSSVGGKVGVNHPQAKNLIGAFHQPLGVVIDTDALATLPDREFRSGLAEVVKYGVILDAEFFAFLEANVTAITRREPEAVRQVIARSCRLKADVVEQDEYETTGLRAVLNYGHTFGHAFEALCGYGGLLHGEAVAIGMVYASRLAERLGRIDAAATARQVNLLKQMGLPTSLPAEVSLRTDDVLDRMKLDKKADDGRMRFILPTRIGHVELVDHAREADVRAVLDPDVA